MKTRRLAIFVVIVALAGIGSASKVAAGPTILNGNFDQGTDVFYQFDHWTVDPVTGGQIYTTGDDWAVMKEEESTEPVLLRFYQDFTLAAQDEILAFNLQINSGESGETDHFYAYLGQNNFYSWNNDDGPSSVVQPITLDVSGLSGQTVRLAFELSFDGNDPMTTVAVGNVRTQAMVVPVPSAIILAGLGLSLIMGYHQRTSKKQ
jgi:hypothetical protein